MTKKQTKKHRESLPPWLSRIYYHTRRMQRVLGRTPSLPELATTCEVSKAAVAKALRMLEERGYIRRVKHYARRIDIL